MISIVGIKGFKNIILVDYAIELIAREFFLSQYDNVIREIYDVAIPELNIRPESVHDIVENLFGRPVNGSQDFQVYIADADVDRALIEREADYIFRSKSDEGKTIFLKRVKTKEVIK